MGHRAKRATASEAEASERHWAVEEAEVYRRPTETVNNVRKGFRRWMRTAIYWVDCLDANRSSKTEFKEASDVLIEGYWRMHALDEENIMIKKDKETGVEILHHAKC